MMKNYIKNSFILVLVLSLLANFSLNPTISRAFEISNKLAANQTTGYVELSPKYNVSPTEEFVFKFNSNLFDGDGTIYKYVKVYDDLECTNEIWIDIETDYDTGTVVVKPPTYLSSPNIIRDSIPEDQRSWGGSSKYYLVISRDMESSNFVELETPLRMMFTVKSEIQVPDLNFRLTSDGEAELYWNKIEGAQEYKIYKGPSYSSTKVLDYYTNTTATSFKDFTVINSFTGTPLNGSTNEGFEGCFYVSAVVNGVESRVSNYIDAEQLIDQIPNSIDDDYFTVSTIYDLPSTATVRMKDYFVVKNYPIIWDYANATIIEPSVTLFTDDGTRSGFIKGKVKGTPLEVECNISEMPSKETLQELAKNQKSSANTGGAISAKDEIADNPPPNLDVDSESQTNIIQEQPSNNAGNTLEGYIAEHMMNMESVINLSMFPEAGNSEILSDTVLMVISQYPLILGEESMSYDYASDSLLITYQTTDKAGVEKKQKEIMDKVKQVVKDVIKPGMTDYEKEKALHDWLTANTVYDFEALEIAEQNNFQEMPKGHEDSFNPYGVLINGVGVCQSYAEAYKLLCTEAELDCVVARGDMTGVPHAWNLVKMGGETYYHVDTTNNDDSPFPYPVFNSPDADIALEYTLGDDFALDSQLMTYQSLDNNFDYYFINNLVITDTHSLKARLTSAIKNKEELVFMKLSSNISDMDFEDTLQSVYYDSSSLESLSYGEFASVKYIMLEY
ncbi:transglutaminase domain-containing protein [Vallitalea okinawensis]|uniref:transglutaminase domain-containing protein n=1 Tax=Vallitalea okinawensis TaxID=2078660 RepID=UPI000CFCF68D|nr:transglutaminase domain-containing protein [Vallitalea okinawensis]